MLHPSIDDLEQQLRAVSDPDDAAQMERYMKHRFEFLGVKTPQRRAISRPLERMSKRLSISDLTELVDDLRDRRSRELHYVASDVLRANRARLPAASIDDVSRWIVTDAWWDTVDAIASPTVGEMVAQHPGLVEVMDAWIDAPVDGDEMWLVRTAILHQLRYGDATDPERLFGYAIRRAGEPEFFIRKAIGWALRQYARTDPDAVRRFVDAHRGELSALSIREATKHL